MGQQFSHQYRGGGALWAQTLLPAFPREQLPQCHLVEVRYLELGWQAGCVAGATGENPPPQEGIGDGLGRARVWAGRGVSEGIRVGWRSGGVGAVLPLTFCAELWTLSWNDQTGKFGLSPVLRADEV